MNFTTPLFFYFFLLVFLLRWGISFFARPDKNTGVMVLLAASYLFYMSWDYQLAFLLFFVSLSDFLLAARLEKTREKKYLILSLVVDLAILGYFKYSAFFSGNLFALTGMSIFALPFFRDVVLPLGISFYIFQSMAYVIDVYRGDTRAEKNFFHYALFLSFFPQLVAGPVVSSRTLLPQFRLKKTLAGIKFQLGVYYLLSGFVKKSVLADSVSVYADRIFAAPEGYSWEMLLAGVVSYSIQIYCDFSGYSDMAVGLGHLLGFELPENFNMPYIASSFSEFWKRWHITLSGWLKSYLYISLGGNRISAFHTYRNLVLTMLLGGLWHGASWNFVVWGGLHGFFLAAERFVRGRIRFPLPVFFKRLFVFVVVSLLWVFFRADDFSVAIKIISGIFFLQGGQSGSFVVFALVFLAVVFSHIAGIAARERLEQMIASKAALPVFATATVVAVFLAANTRPFIYFVF